MARLRGGSHSPRGAISLLLREGVGDASAFSAGVATGAGEVAGARAGAPGAAAGRTGSGRRTGGRAGTRRANGDEGGGGGAGSVLRLRSIITLSAKVTTRSLGR